MIKRGNDFYRIKPRSAEVIDATGAGDLYAAGFLYGHSLDLSLQKCGDIGSVLASKVVEVVGPKINIPRWKEGKREIRKIIAANEEADC